MKLWRRNAWDLVWYQEAEAALQELLRIHKMNLKPDHSMLINTLKRMVRVSAA